MAQWLKQSTAATIKMGPFVDDTDGKTAETALSIAQANIRLTKNGGAFAQSNNTAGATHDENGYYDVPLDTTDTNTLGCLRVAVLITGALPVWQDFMVISSNVFNSLIGGGENLLVAVPGQVGVSGTVVASAVQGGFVAVSGTVVASAVQGGTVTVSGTIPSNADIIAIKAKTDQLVFTLPNQVDANALSGGGGLDAVGVRGAMGLASANLDAQLAALPTAAENAAELISEAAVTPVKVNVKKINDTNLTGNGSVGTPWGPA